MSPAAIIASLLGVASAATFLLAMWSVRWPRTKGVIDVSIFDTEWEVDSTPRGAAIEKRGRFYLAYSYSVDGKSFQRSRISPVFDLDWQVSGSPHLSSARGRSQWYREGASVDVSYCPLLPGWSCLEPGGFVIAALLAAGAVVAFVAS